jgi:hypothetical protein
MAHAEDILKLRTRFVDAIQSGLGEKESSDLYLATLISIINDAERERVNHSFTAQKLKEQACGEEGQARAFSAIGSMVYNVVNGFISKSEQAARELQERQNEQSGDGSAKE